MRTPEKNLMEENVATKVEKACYAVSARENYLQGDNTTGGAAGGSIENFSKNEITLFYLFKHMNHFKRLNKLGI